MTPLTAGLGVGGEGVGLGVWGVGERDSKHARRPDGRPEGWGGFRIPGDREAN